MKILHVHKVSPLVSYGGMETVINVLCKATSDQGITNTVLSLSEHPAEKHLKTYAYTLYEEKKLFSFASTNFSINAFRKFKELANEHDIIHYHYPNPYADLLHLYTKPSKPSLITYHSDIVRQKLLFKLYKPLQNSFLSSVDQIVATSPNYFATSSVLQRFRNKVTVIPLSVDVEDFQVSDPDLLTYWQKRIKGPFFLFVGALRYYKGLFTLLEAVKGTNIKVVIAGSSGLEKKIKQFVKYQEIHNVTLLGAISEKDKIALLQLCYSFVFPSNYRSEAFGVSLLEAAASGKSLISSEIGTGTSFINIANETGLVVPPNCCVSLRDAMVFLLENPKIAHKMGLEAKNRVKIFFNSNTQSTRYVQLYDEIIGSKT